MNPFFFYVGNCCGFLALPFFLALDSHRPSKAVAKVQKHSAEIILLDDYRRRRYASSPSSEGDCPTGRRVKAESGKRNTARTPFAVHTVGPLSQRSAHEQRHR